MQTQPAEMQMPVVSASDNEKTNNDCFLLQKKYPKIARLMKFEQLQLPSEINDKRHVFCCSATVEDREISATGFSKKEARAKLATELLIYLDNAPPEYGLKFASAATVKGHLVAGKKRAANGQSIGDESPMQVTSDEFRNDAKRRKILNKLDGTNFVQAFQQMCDVMGEQFKPLSVEYVTCSSADAKPHETVMECHLTVGDKKFSAKGASKKLLKQEVIKQAFKEVFGVEVGKDVTDRQRNEVLNLLTVNGLKNLRQTLQTYAGRHSLLFKVDCNEVVDDSTAQSKIRKYIATCQFGDKSFQCESPLSKKNCLEQLFARILLSVFHIDLDRMVGKDGGDVCSNMGSIGTTNVGPVADKSPVSLLYELCQKNGLQVTFSDPTQEEISADLAQKPPPPSKNFSSKVTVDKNIVIGYGRGRKVAKQEAAIQMLKLVFSLDIADNPAHKVFDASKMERRLLTEKKQFLARFSDGDPERLHAAKVACYAKMKYAQILQEFNVVPLSIFAAFLIRDSNKTDDEFEVVSLASGSKTSQILSDMPGLNLRDCHSAVLARRGLLLYFYSQLAKFSGPDAESSIFELIPDQKPDAQKDQPLYRLKSNYSIHLYDSRIPPGDASADQYDVNYRNCLRVYQKDGVSTMPVTAINKMMADVQTPFMEPLANSGQHDNTSMSLSDKMLKWNVVGLQGALLSLLIEPIYLDSLVIGQDYNKAVVRKSIFGRFDLNWWAPMKAASALNTVLAKYEPRCPKLYNVQVNPIKMQPQRAVAEHRGTPIFGDEIREPTDFGLTWQICCYPPAEFVFQATGLDIQRKMSRLSKQSMFDHYTRLRQLLSLPKDRAGLFYDKAKQSSTAYVSAKLRFKNVLGSNNLGVWLNKSDLIDHFTLPWLNK